MSYRVRPTNVSTDEGYKMHNVHTMPGYQKQIQGGGGGIGWLATPHFGSFKFEIKRRNKTITEAILLQVTRHRSVRSARPLPPSFKNPGTATGTL